MLGAIIGDIVGSIYEFDNIHTKDFKFFGNNTSPTDDSYMTLAICKAIMDSNKDLSNLKDKTIYWMQHIGRATPEGCYGGHFSEWLYEANPKSYGSFGNGSAMRISSIPFLFGDLETCLKVTEVVTSVTHNHPEGIKGAKAVVEAMHMLKHGASKDEVIEVIKKKYYPNMDLSYQHLFDDYGFYEICQKTVPEAFTCFYNATSFEDAIRNAISVGGDSDTLACITGALAECFYEIPNWMIKEAEDKIRNAKFSEIYFEFKDRMK